MMTLAKKIAGVTSAVAVSLAVGIGSAHAGGLFGDGGLIRGDVGNWLDKHVENPITTPAARTLAEAAGAAGGAIAGGYIGGPTGAAVGGLVGQRFGMGINDSFAGGRPGSGAVGGMSPVQGGYAPPRAYRAPMPPAYTPQPYNYSYVPMAPTVPQYGAPLRFGPPISQYGGFPRYGTLTPPAYWGAPMALPARW